MNGITLIVPLSGAQDKAADLAHRLGRLAARHRDAELASLTTSAIAITEQLHEVLEQIAAGTEVSA